MFASIDVGTNSVLLTIAQKTADGFAIVLQRATVTRLGQGVDQSGTLHPDAETRTLDCLREYRAEMDAAGVTKGAAVGTSALRDARGGEAFLEQAALVLGFPLEVISGQREAELTFFGGISGIGSAAGTTLVFDIGGGSTELILGNASTRKIVRGTSLNVGSVRLTERLALQDPPTKQSLEQLRSVIDEQLGQFALDATELEDAHIIGVAGTVTTLAAIEKQVAPYDPARIHGSVLQADSLHALAERIFFMPVAERLGLTGLSKGRADVIGAGAILCSQIVKQTGNRPLTVSDRGVRFGLLEQLAAESN